MSVTLAHFTGVCGGDGPSSPGLIVEEGQTILAERTGGIMAADALSFTTSISVAIAYTASTNDQYLSDSKVLLIGVFCVPFHHLDSDVGSLRKLLEFWAQVEALYVISTGPIPNIQDPELHKLVPARKGIRVDTIYVSW